jgi:hypothetical protein
VAAAARDDAVPCCCRVLDGASDGSDRVAQDRLAVISNRLTANAVISNVVIWD